jgi:hypothetical protein
VGRSFSLGYRSLPAIKTSGPCQNHRVSAMIAAAERVEGRDLDDAEKAALAQFMPV